MIALDLVNDKLTREPIDLDTNITARLAEACREAGAVIRPVGTKLCIAPPLIIDKDGCDLLVNAVQYAFDKIKK